MAQKIQLRIGVKKNEYTWNNLRVSTADQNWTESLFSSRHYLNRNVKMPIYPGYVCVGQSQDPLPVGSVDEEAIWLGDGRNVGP